MADRKLNVNPRRLFLSEVNDPSVKDDFVAQDAEMPRDFIEYKSDKDRNQAILDDERADWADEIDRDSMGIGRKEDLDPDDNPAQQVGPYKRSSYQRISTMRLSQREILAKDLRNFSKFPRKGVVARVIVDPNGSLVGSPVVLRLAADYGKKARTHLGTVIARDEREICVLWHDKTATIEKKRNFLAVAPTKKAAKPRRVFANQYIKKDGDDWVITQKGTGKILSRHDSKEKAEASFRAMEWGKHGGSVFANKYIRKDGDDWVITQKGTGKILSRHDSEEKAEAAFRAMEWSKHGG